MHALLHQLKLSRADTRVVAWTERGQATCLWSHKILTSNGLGRAACVTSAGSSARRRLIDREESDERCRLNSLEPKILHLQSLFRMLRLRPPATVRRTGAADPWRGDPAVATEQLADRLEQMQ